MNENEDERVRIVKKIATRFIKGCGTQTLIKPSFNDGLRVQFLIDKIRQNKL